MALREIGLAAGEPPATKGYPPSVFAALPRLLERVAPLRSGGSITGVYTVLVEGDDLADPVADSARSLLDGHLVLSRDLAARGHFPALDVLQSTSRVATKVTTSDVQRLQAGARSILATRREAEELRSLGAYVAGQNPVFDEALAIGARLDTFMQQTSSESSPSVKTTSELAQILGKRGTK
jgi:flagellum-specific ATP synthase